jgi:hypothetical protein
MNKPTTTKGSNMNNAQVEKLIADNFGLPFASNCSVSMLNTVRAALGKPGVEQGNLKAEAFAAVACMFDNAAELREAGARF